MTEIIRIIKPRELGGAQRMAQPSGGGGGLRGEGWQQERGRGIPDPGVISGWSGLAVPSTAPWALRGICRLLTVGPRPRGCPGSGQTGVMGGDPQSRVGWGRHLRLCQMSKPRFEI